MQQRDSRATAKLTRSANLLAKFGVIFLPVSLMTAYFSVQIPDLTNAYSGTTYWATFAVVLGISLIGLFFFGKVLMKISETLEHYSDQAWSVVSRKKQAGKADVGNGGVHPGMS